MNFKDKRVLVTGGKGFVGSALCKRLRELGSIVNKMDQVPKWQQGDVSIFSHVQQYFARYSPQIVFHLAAKTEVRKSFEEPEEFYQTNVLGTLNVLECCRRHPVEAVVIASSDKAYCNPADDCLYSESMPLGNRGDFYSHTKKAADELAQTYGRLYGLPVRIARCANIYGPGQKNETTLITATIANLMRGQRPVIHRGFENVKREWLYIDDAVDAYICLAKDAAERKTDTVNTGALAYNVGSGDRLSVLMVVQKICQAMDSTCTDVDIKGIEVPQLGSQGLNCTKFRTQFPNWQHTAFEAGLNRTIAWQREP